MKRIRPERRVPELSPSLPFFSFFAAVVALISGASLLFPNPVWNRMWSLNPAAYAAFESLGPVAGLLLLTLAGIAAAAGAGVLLRKTWAWWIALALCTVNGLGDVFGVFSTHDVARGVPGFLVVCGFVFWLTRSGVRRYFRGARSSST